MEATTKAIGVESVLRLLRFHGIVLINTSKLPVEEMRAAIVAEAKTDADAVNLALSLTCDPNQNPEFSLRWKNDLRENLQQSGAIK